MGQSQFSLSKSHFRGGMPHNHWLKENLIGEAYNHTMGFKNHGLVKKYHIYVPDDDTTTDMIMNINRWEDIPKEWEPVAIDLIRLELDRNFLRRKKHRKHISAK